MESPPLAANRIHPFVTQCNLVCVVTLLGLCATPITALTTSSAPDTSLTAYIQPSFTTTANTGSLTDPQAWTTSFDNDGSSVVPSSSGHSSAVVAEEIVNLSDATHTSSTRLSNQLSSSHVEFQSSPVTDSETLHVLPMSISSPSHQLEATYTPSLHSVVASTTLLSASYSPEAGGMNSSVSPESSVRTTVSSNDTQGSTSAVGIVVTSTLSPGFGNGSCSGNNTGCPEYNGKQDLALSTPAIIGIAVGAAVLVIIVVCLALFMCRRRRTLSGSKADLSTYWDDNVTLSYINGHLDYPKDMSDEMVSLDNDSFLNSLDSMSFSNMWATENAKHTNF